MYVDLFDFEEKKLKTAVQVWPHGRCWGLPRFLGPILSSRWWNWSSSEIINKEIYKQTGKKDLFQHKQHINT